MRISINAIAVRGPGLPGWQAARERMAGRVAWRPEPLSLPVIELLSANERRRLTPLIKLALAVACEATQDMQPEARAALPAVFASSAGDSQITHRLCTAMSQSPGMVSPTDFHNSVHNAPAGYWSIATASRMASISIAAGEWTAGAGFLEAISQVQATGQEILLVIYDALPPASLMPLSRIQDGFGLALRIAPAEFMSAQGVGCDIRICAHAETRLPEPWASLSRLGPTARWIGLPHAIACRQLRVVMPLDARRNVELALEWVDHGKSRF